MLTTQGHGVEITRGDHIRWRVRVRGQVLEDDTQCVFTVKRTEWEHAEPVIEKVFAAHDGVVDVLLGPEDTDIPAGHYTWQIKARVENEGHTYERTIMRYSSLEVTEGHCNE